MWAAAVAFLTTAMPVLNNVCLCVQVVALEQRTAEEKKEKLAMNEERRAELLKARQAALEARKKELARRAASRDALIAEKNAHMKKLEEEVLAEVREEWEEKERRIIAARELKEKQRAAQAAAREQANKKRMEEALKRERTLAEEDRQRREAAIKEKVCCVSLLLLQPLVPPCKRLMGSGSDEGSTAFQCLMGVVGVYGDRRNVPPPS